MGAEIIVFFRKSAIFSNKVRCCSVHIHISLYSPNFTIVLKNKINYPENDRHRNYYLCDIRSDIPNLFSSTKATLRLPMVLSGRNLGRLKFGDLERITSSSEKLVKMFVISISSILTL